MHRRQTTTDKQLTKLFKNIYINKTTDFFQCDHSLLFSLLSSYSVCVKMFLQQLCTRTSNELAIVPEGVYGPVTN
jgi:hypothetical protein